MFYLLCCIKRDVSRPSFTWQQRRCLGSEVRLDVASLPRGSPVPARGLLDWAWISRALNSSRYDEFGTGNVELLR